MVSSIRHLAQMYEIFSLADMHKPNRHTYQLLLLNKLDVSKSFRCKFNSLIKAVLTSVRHVNDLYDFCLQPLQ